MSATGYRSPREDTPSAADRSLAGLLGRDAVYVVLLAVQLLAAALVTPFVTRLMGRGEFGLLASANAVMQVLFVVAGAGLATGLQRQHAQGGERGARQLLTLAAGVALLVGGVAELTSRWWVAPLGLGGSATLVHLSVAWAATSALTGASLALLRSQDRIGAFALISLLQSVVAEVTSLLLVSRASGSGARWFVEGQLLAQVAAMAVGLVLVPPARLGRGTAPMARSVLRFSLPLVPGALSAFVLASADRLLLQRLVGADAVGGYQVAYNMASVPMLLLGLLSSSWLPRLFALDDARASVLEASRNAVYSLLPPIVVGMCLGGPLVLRLWAPASYRPTELLLTFAVVVVGVVPTAGVGAAGRTLLVAGRSGTAAATNAAAAVLNVVLNLVLDPVAGVVGAAVATTVSLAVLWLITAAAAHRVVPQPLAPSPLLVLLALSVVAGLLSAAAPQDGWALAVRLVLSGVALAWLVLAAVRVRSRAAGAPGAAA